ncbi:hypothetical protein VIBNIFTn2_120084 [Vibrio nigripulchritudo FTn2]|nr:hypothetical protein VIBNIFTn2_120084 [Vibrio nigripulchritudo FTn2]
MTNQERLELERLNRMDRTLGLWNGVFCITSIIGAAVFITHLMELWMPMVLEISVQDYGHVQELNSCYSRQAITNALKDNRITYFEFVELGSKELQTIKSEIIEKSIHCKGKLQ